MSKHEQQGHGGYEKTDADAGATYRAGLYILGTMFLTALGRGPDVPLPRPPRGARQQAPAATVLKADAERRPGRLPEARRRRSRAALAEFRAQEDAFLTSYGWVEKDKGVARMPIDEAMRIVAERGPADVPGAPEPAAAPAGGAR